MEKSCHHRSAWGTLESGPISNTSRGMTKSIDGIIWQADADTLRFHHVSGSVSDILGYSAEDWLSTDDFWQSRLHPEDADRIIETCVNLSRQRLPHRLTYRMIAADGREVWLQDNVKVVEDGAQATLFGIMIDVTDFFEERRTLEAASRQNAHYRALYDLVPVAIWEEDWTGVLAELRRLHAQGISDIGAHARDTPGFTQSMLDRLRVLAVNAGAVDMFRAANAAELVARAHEVFEADQPKSVFLTALDAILRGERQIEGVTTLRRLDGEKAHVQFRIVLPGIEDREAHVVICEMDITAAHAAQERLELVTRATSDVIWDFDIRRDTLWAGDGLQQNFGLDPAEMQGSLEKWTRRIHPDDIDGTMRQFDRIMNEGNDRWNQEYRFLTGDGTYVWVRDEGIILRNAEGEAVRMTGSLVDITEQRKMEERLLQSQRIEAMGKLTGGMAHDFNNLLTIVMGSLEALEDSFGDDPEARQNLDVANRAVDRSARLINQLLSFARKQPMAPQSIDMAQSIGEMSQIIARTLGEQIDIRLDVAPGLWKCRTDPSQLESALLNLCINARDAMSGGGVLTIGLRNAEVAADCTPAVQGLTPGRYVVVSVTDSGHGMDEATRRSAFEPFFTTKGPGGGSGLGLSMVQGFAHQSKGIVEIQSEPGSGTQVSVYLPAVASAGTAHTLAAAPGKAEREGAGHILLVEDQDMVRDHLTALLASLGYEVTAVGTVAEAVSVLASDTRFDLLLSDIVLPGGESGLDLARRVEVTCPGLPVIFTSGYHEAPAGAGAKLREGQNFLRKPFRRNDLITLLQRVLPRD